MYSHARRKDIRAESLRAFDAVGLPVDHVRVQTAPPSQPENRKNAWRALQDAFDGSDILLLEDDVIPADTLGGWLAYLQAREDRPVSLFASARHFYPPDSLKDRTSRVVTLQSLRAWYGSQAVYMPARIVERVLADPAFLDPELAPWEKATRGAGGPFDRAFREHLQGHGEAMGLTIPNVVQHRAPPSVVQRDSARPTSPYFDTDAPPPR